MSPLQHPRLTTFIRELSALITAHGTADEAGLLERSAPLLATLVSQDDWLAPSYSQPHPQHYQQYLLYLDPQQRFSVVSFVWGPGQQTPVHDHRVWGLIGMLRGAEHSQSFVRGPDGMRPDGEAVLLQPGEVETLSPAEGDIHQVSNAFRDRVSVSIHVYGADIGKVERAIYLPDGSEKLFISGYASQPQPTVTES
ncbi:cysteine dioxygenase [Tatumella terrea]|uniref:Cysteine dioxygenase n=1 Tax=Tatumella terrea TaxID=419007 RepID=A0ABW1VUB8_9GAMM